MGRVAPSLETTAMPLAPETSAPGIPMNHYATGIDLIASAAPAWRVLDSRHPI